MTVCLNENYRAETTYFSTGSTRSALFRVHYRNRKTDGFAVSDFRVHENVTVGLFYVTIQQTAPWFQVPLQDWSK